MNSDESGMHSVNDTVFSKSFSDDDFTIAGYDLIDCIGSGGMGKVWRAKNSAGEDVALKLMHPCLCTDPQALKRIQREVTILSKLDNDGIASLLDYELDDDVPFVVTELIYGPTLKEKIQNCGKMSLEDTFIFASKLYETLKYLHSQNVVHRDIKPSNIIMADRPVLIDFGISQFQYDDRITGTGFVAGTPGFVSPEVFNGSIPNFASDMWSLASVVGFAMTGKPPFGSDCWGQVMARSLSGVLVYTQDDMPLQCLEALCACLDPDPEKRACFESFLAVLHSIIDNCEKFSDYSDYSVSSADKTLFIQENTPGNTEYLSEMSLHETKLIENLSEDSSDIVQDSVVSDDDSPDLFYETSNTNLSNYEDYDSNSFDSQQVDNGIKRISVFNVIAFICMLSAFFVAVKFFAFADNNFMSFVIISGVLLFFSFLNNVDVDLSKNNFLKFFILILKAPFYLFKSLWNVCKFWAFSLICSAATLFFVDGFNVEMLDILRECVVNLSFFVSDISLSRNFLLLLFWGICVVFCKSISKSVRILLVKLNMSFIFTILFYIISFIMICIFCMV